MVDVAELKDARRAGIGATDTMVSANGIGVWHKDNAAVLNTSGDRTTIVDGSNYTAEQFMRLARMDWNVEKRPIFMADNTPVPEFCALVRSTDGMQLGVVKSTRPIVQNVTAFQTMDAFISGGFGSWETAGTLWDGRLVYVSIRIEDRAEILPGDTIVSYLTLSNAHGEETHGSSRCIAGTRTDVRPVCNNTLRAGQRKGTALFRIRHVGNVEAQLAEAKRQYLAVCESAKKTRELYRSMTRVQLDSAGIEAYIKECLYPGRPVTAEDSDGVYGMLAPVPEITARERARAEKRQQETIDRIMGLADHGKGTDIPGVRGSLWGAYNAVTEYASHDSPLRGTSREQSVMVGSAGKILDRATDVAAKMVRA